MVESGPNIIQLLGFINLLLVLFQMLSGFRIIKVKNTIHRTTGVLLVFSAIIHAALAFIAQNL